MRGWLAPRGLSYLARRARSLVNRYGFTSGRARRRIDDCVAILAAHECAPSFMVPGRVVQTHPAYCRSLVDRGAELALHGFDHVDFKTLSPAAIVRQFERSADAFERAGIPFHGFRCPYLSATDELFQHLPRGVVSYSSNVAVRWSEAGVESTGNAVARQLETFYAPLDADTTIVLPSCARRHDRASLFASRRYSALRRAPGGRAGSPEAWCRMLDAVYARGELHVLLFHPELADRCRRALGALLTRARSLEPHVWVATLGDVAAWWRERSECTVSRAVGENGRLVFSLQGSPRASLVAGQAAGREVCVAAEPLPLVGISAPAPASYAPGPPQPRLRPGGGSPRALHGRAGRRPCRPGSPAGLEQQPQIRVAGWPTARPRRFASPATCMRSH